MNFTQEQLNDMTPQEINLAAGIKIYGSRGVSPGTNEGINIDVDIDAPVSVESLSGCENNSIGTAFIDTSGRRGFAENAEVAGAIIHDFKLYVKPPIKEGGKWKVGSNEIFALDKSLIAAVIKVFLMIEVSA